MKEGQSKSAIDRADSGLVLELIKEIGEQERHFNTLVGGYKTMASTWLLSAFGAIGFILANSFEPKLLFVAGIGLAGGIGIYLLWLMDIMVYQQLLAANFVEGLKLEDQNKWLPQIRHNMTDTQETGSVTKNLAWFYLVGISLPLLIFLYALGSYLLINASLGFALLFIIAGGSCLFLLVNKILFSSKEVSLHKMYEKISSGLVDGKKIIMAVGFFLIYLGAFTVIYFNIDSRHSESKPGTMSLKKDYDYLAPDKSEIRLLFSLDHGGLAHCVLPPQGVSHAVEHNTVEEIWYILSGKGELWRKKGGDEQIVGLRPDVCITIPVHTAFQFRNTGTDSLKILISTMPPWPGDKEASRVMDYWDINTYK